MCQLCPGELQGTFAGSVADAVGGVGVGRHGWAWWSRDGVRLQPLSVEGQIGISVAPASGADIDVTSLMWAGLRSTGVPTPANMASPSPPSRPGHCGAPRNGANQRTDGRPETIDQAHPTYAQKALRKACDCRRQRPSRCRGRTRVFGQEDRKSASFVPPTDSILGWKTCIRGPSGWRK